MEVQEVTKNYVVINDEKIYFDEPFDRKPSKDEFERWFQLIRDLIETLFCSEATK